MNKHYKNLTHLLLSICLMGFSLNTIGQTDAFIGVFDIYSLSTCGTNTITPELMFINQGTTPISSVSYTVTLDGVELLMTSETINIPVDEGVLFILEPMELEYGNHNLTFEIVTVNGAPDDDTSNNTESVDFEIEDGLGVFLEVLSDNFGQEVSMEIINENGQVVASLNENTLDDNTLINLEYCLPVGCYTFSITDQFGDGICCQYGNGYYELTNAYGQLLGTGGDYGEGESFEFCLEVIVLEALDLAMVSVSPEGNFCSSNIPPTVTFRNEGENNITSALFEYSFNGESLGEIDWAGNISSFEEITLNLPLVTDVELGENTLNVNLVSVNGTSDDDPSNDTYLSEMNIIGESGFTVTLEVESGFGGGNRTYTILDSDGNIIEEIDPLPNGSELTLPYCYPEACFSIVLTDNFDEGGVDFTITSDAGYEIATSENFTDELISYFCTSIPLNLDASVSNILHPIDGAGVCGTSISPAIELFNNGLETVTEIVLEYTYNDSLTLEETWTGNLPTYNKSSIVLPEQTNLAGGNHNFTVNIVSVNGETDEETNNNAMSESFIIIDAETYTLNFTADTSPEENSYQITDSLGNVLFSGEQGLFQNPFATSKEEFCLYPGCYIITLFDEGGNGGPNVSVTNENDSIILQGYLTGPELNLDFCIEEEEDEVIVDPMNGLNELPETAAIELFPNPSTGLFYLNHQLEGNYQITVQDLLGKQVFAQNLAAGQNIIDLENGVTNGIYLLTIENEVERSVYKITLVR